MEMKKIEMERMKKISVDEEKGEEGEGRRKGRVERNRENGGEKNK